MKSFLAVLAPYIFVALVAWGFFLWLKGKLEFGLDKVGDLVSKASQDAAFQEGTKLIRDKLSIAQSHGWVDANGSLTATGRAAVADGSWKKAMGGA